LRSLWRLGFCGFGMRLAGSTSELQAQKTGMALLFADLGVDFFMGHQILQISRENDESWYNRAGGRHQRDSLMGGWVRFPDFVDRASVSLARLTSLTIEDDFGILSRALLSFLTPCTGVGSGFESRPIHPLSTGDLLWETATPRIRNEPNQNARIRSLFVK